MDEISKDDARRLMDKMMPGDLIAYSQGGKLDHLVILLGNDGKLNGKVASHTYCRSDAIDCTWDNDWDAIRPPGGDYRVTLLQMPHSATFETLIDLNGRWAFGGTPGPVISAAFKSLTIDMSAYHRPSAHGSIGDSSTMTVTFPDDATYTGKLQLPNTIEWSNGSAWTKVSPP